MHTTARLKQLFREVCVFLVAALCASSSMAQTTVDISFELPAPPSLTESDGGNTGTGGQVQEAVGGVVFPPTLPKEMKEEKAPAEGEAAPVLREELNQVGSAISFEHFSNDALGRDGNVYGASASYEKRMDPTPVKLGAILNYQFFDLDNQYGEDFNANRMVGVFYGTYGLLKKPLEVWAGGVGHASYTMNTKDVDDYAAFGGGAYVSIGKSFKVVELTLGASYIFTKYDIDLEDDHSHLIRYGISAGVPVGRKLAMNVYFTETRNPTDYERAVIDKNFFTVGAEGTYAIAGSWVLSGGYRTILDYEDFSSHMGYLGTLVKF